MSELAVVPTLEKCEAEIEKANESAKVHHATIGKYLTMIKDGKLYQDQYESFEEYCINRWEFRKSYAYQLMSNVKVLEDLSTQAETEIDQPESAGQVTAIGKTSKSPKVRAKVWETAKAISDNPTTAVIQKAAAIVTSPGGGESAEIDAAVAQMTGLCVKIENCGKRIQLAIEAKMKASAPMRQREKKFKTLIDDLANSVKTFQGFIGKFEKEWKSVKGQVDE